MRIANLQRLLALLEAARAELVAGWVQGGWWSVRTGSGASSLVTGLAAAGGRSSPGSGVCLVGALVRAGWGNPAPGSEVGRAVDAVYDALWESRGQPPDQPAGVAVSAPSVRLARVQTLTGWNDQAGRTHEDVLALMDRAIAGTLLDLVSLQPAGRAGVITTLPDSSASGQAARTACTSAATSSE